MMKEKLKISYPILVEGKYDKLRLCQIAEAQILTTDGFGLFKKTEKTELFRALAKKTPLIVLTDSDGAGKVIRSFLTSILPADRLIHLYIPKIEGKEKRKSEPSAEGTLGVEGMENDLLYDLLKPYENFDFSTHASENPLSKADFFADGLTGTPDSKKRRNALAKELGLPPDMTPNALLSAVRILCTYEEYREIIVKS